GVIGLETDIEPEQDPRADPWNSYYAARFAWVDEDAEAFRSVGLSRRSTELRQIESPLFVEMVTEKSRMAILTGGLPYHRRVELRMLDTMLIVRGEGERKFRLGIALDHPQPVEAAVEWLAPGVAVRERPAPPRGATSSWLFHLDLPNVIATHWEPLVNSCGVVEGFMVRLQETGSRAAKLKLTSIRRPKS